MLRALRALPGVNPDALLPNARRGAPSPIASRWCSSPASRRANSTGSIPRTGRRRRPKSRSASRRRWKSCGRGGCRDLDGPGGCRGDRRGDQVACSRGSARWRRSVRVHPDRGGQPPRSARVSSVHLQDERRGAVIAHVDAGESSVDEIQRIAVELAREERPHGLRHDGRAGFGGRDGRMGRSEHVPSIPLRGPIDVVGAGDSVTANLAAALAAGRGIARSLEHGGARVVDRDPSTGHVGQRFGGAQMSATAG